METILKKPFFRSDLIWSAIWITTISLLVLKFAVYQQVNVIGESMEPNYYTNEMLLVNTIDKNLVRGRVVAVYEDIEAAKDATYFTRFNTKFYLKRIIGLPNEEIEVVGSAVIIYNDANPNGAVLDEPYIGDKARNTEEQRGYYYPRTKIPTESYFVMGDNRSNSTDSRIRGFFPKYAIFGQETLRYWPFDRYDYFRAPNYNPQPINENLQKKREEIKAKSQFKPSVNLRETI
jgi:signal peptidase I